MTPAQWGARFLAPSPARNHNLHSQQIVPRAERAGVRANPRPYDVRSLG